MSAGGYGAEPIDGGPKPRALLAALCCWRTVSRKFDFSVPSIDSSRSLCRIPSKIVNITLLSVHWMTGARLRGSASSSIAAEVCHRCVSNIYAFAHDARGQADAKTGARGRSHATSAHDTMWVMRRRQRTAARAAGDSALPSAAAPTCCSRTGCPRWRTARTS